MARGGRVGKSAGGEGRPMRARRVVARRAIRARASSEARGLVTTQWRFVVFALLNQTAAMIITRRRGRRVDE